MNEGSNDIDSNEWMPSEAMLIDVGGGCIYRAWVLLLKHLKFNLNHNHNNNTHTQYLSNSQSYTYQIEIQCQTNSSHSTQTNT